MNVSATRRVPTPPAPHALHPLVLALLAAFPVTLLAQTAVVRPTAPAAAVVPRPMAGWRVSGAGAALPVTRSNSAGGIDQSINQTSTSAIYNWQTFDIGAKSSVTFNLPTASSSALNRVTGSSAPSQIFGSLKSQYTNPTPDGAPLIGGSIYLYNANGIIFGRGAQVNVGSLFASTLNLKDSDYLDNLTASITGKGASFSFDTSTPSLFTDDRNFVLVDPGAAITTASGGRVFLFAKNVQNGGTITAPDGQVALAGGGSVYLQDPTLEKLYASESNANYPVLRGLLVEVGAAPGGNVSGSASNLVGGVIDTARGNTTLVGMAVNQLGRISATTSVSENGSVFLLARGGAVDGVDKTNTFATKRATASGALTLGAGSTVEIAPDTTLGADGKPVTSDGNSIFTASRVELAGKTIEFASGATIVAHGGVVNARAEATPNYRDNGAPDYTQFDGNDAVRIVMADDAAIDVSGTTDASVSAGRNFVTTQLIGKSDLKDAPLQKDGPLYRSKVTFDLRSAVPILGDTSAYTSAIQRDATERLASGGSVLLSSTGAVVTGAKSSLDVAGGQVNYTAATVVPTRLVAADGSRYTLNQAPKDTLYTAIEGASTPTQDRWGIVPQYVPSQATTGQVAPGYVDGKAGGALTIAAPHSILDGQIAAATVTGVRQTGGQDALPKTASVNLGSRNDINPGTGGLIPFGDNAFLTAGLRDLTVTADPQSLWAGFWSSPLDAVLPQTSRIAAETLVASGLGKLTITTDGAITVERGAELALAPSAVLDLAAGGAGGISLGGAFRSEGGSLLARTRDMAPSSVVGATRAGTITLQAGVAIDVSGDLVNRALDGAEAVAATAGGSVTLSAARGLLLQDASRIDVSGGATVSTSGVVAGTAAGSITLESDQKRTLVDAPSQVHLGADLVGRSLVGGGTLALHGMDTVTIGSQAIPRGVKDGLTAGSLQLSPQFFANGTFTYYDVQVASQLQVLGNVDLTLQARNWIVSGAVAVAPSGTELSSVLAQGALPDWQRKPVSLNLSALTPFGSQAAGDLGIAAGAQISTDPLASVNLKAGLHLDLEGRIQAPGGAVNLALVDGTAGSLDTPATGSLVVGRAAAIDVSGTTILQPQTGTLPQGTVVGGGSVALSVTGLNARLTPVQVMPGAVIDADGASAELGVTLVNPSGAAALQQRTVSTSGGSVSILAREGGALLAGDLHADAGGEGVSAGSFSLTLSGVRNSSSSGNPVNLVGSYVIALQEAPVTQTAATQGSVLLSASELGSGFANVALHSRDRIRFNGDLTLGVAGDLTLDAPLLTASPQSRQVTLAAGGELALGNTPATDLPTATNPVAGNAGLSLQGGLVKFGGMQGLQGFKQVAAKADSEIRFAGVPVAGQPGQLSLQADLSLSAPQVDVTSGSAFKIEAPSQQVLITGGSATAAAPMSAGGSIAIDASAITLGDPAGGTAYGVLRAPLGQIALSATDRINIGSGSVVSVSGAGQSVLFGSTVNGVDWTYNGQAVDAPVAKSVSLNAATVNVNAGSTIDASGGGKLLATEFVAGPGGSTDVFAGAAGGAYAILPTLKRFAPQDTDTLAERDASGAVAIAQPSRQITIGAGGPIPAGTYALLPARYALLDGAYLVKPVTSGTPLALGATLARQDGSVWVGGQLGNAGAGTGSSLPQTFQLLNSTLAQTYSQVNQADANTYFAGLATAAGTAAPKLPQDAGRLSLAAQQLTLKGTTLFTLPITGNPVGGELDVSANQILIGTGSGTSTAAPTGTLTLNVADLNATGAAMLVIGGERSATGNELTTGANDLTLDNAGTPLTAADVVLLAKNRLELKPDASVVAKATGATAASNETLSLSGDGALLRVSADPLASTTRTGATRLTGELLIDAAASLTGAAVTAEATRSTAVAADASFKSTNITLGANRIAVGDLTGVSLASTTLALTTGLAAQLGGGQALTLRSFDGIDFYGNAALGGSGLRSLTLDTGVLRTLGGAQATVQAGGVALVNTSGSAAAPAVGSGQLQVIASGSGGGSGQIVIGPGSVAVAGAATTGLTAAQDVTLQDAAQLSSSGDLSIRSRSLQAAQGASASVSVGGTLSLTSNGTAAGSDAGNGAHLALGASAIEAAGRITLPSGALTLAATGGDIHLASGATIDLAGRDKTFDGVVVSTSGGDLAASSAAGSIRIDTGAQVDVSAGSVGGSAGSVGLNATAGSVVIGGGLRGVSGNGQGGATLAVDSGTPLDLGALQGTLAASSGNFGQSISIRNRTGDQQLAAGPGLASRNVTIESDAGSLAINGLITASGASGVTVVLAAGDTLTIGSGAQIAAHSTGSVGGQVQLMAGRVEQAADGSLTPNGQVLLNGGVIDTSAGTGGATGSVLIRAQRSDDGQDVRVAKAAGSTGTTVTGASGIELEAVRQYATETIDGDFIDQVNADNLAFAGTAGANAARSRTRVGGLLAQGPAVQLRAGVEIDQVDPALDLVMAGNDAYKGWNLTAFSSTGKALLQPTGAPVDLTLRSAGNLAILASISDGFMPSGAAPTSARAASVITPTAVVAAVDGAYLDGGRIRLVGGADLAAADVIATVASSDTGDVTIGNGSDVIVRSTTGAIQIAAGRDVTLTDHQAVVYTTGKPTTGPGYVGLAANNLLGSGGVAQSPTLVGGGSVSVVAQRDVSGAGAVDLEGQYASEWLWRGFDNAPAATRQASWWVRYDRFQQGFATFSGGNMTVLAGRDALNVEASAASNGYVSHDANGGVQRQGGGDLTLTAGQDISGGFVLQDQGALTVRSGRDILLSADAAPAGLQVLHGNSQIDIEARNNATVGAVTAFGLVTDAPQTSSRPAGYTLAGTAPDATLRMVTAVGDLNYVGATTPNDFNYAVSSSHSNPTGADQVIPDDAVFAAPGGSVSLGPVTQVSGSGTSLSVLAQTNATLSNLSVAGTDPRQSTPTLLPSGTTFAGTPFALGLLPYYSGNRDPIRIMASSGDISLTDALNVVKPIRVLAGRDVNVGQNIEVQQQGAAELSLLQAGRDVLFTGSGVDTASFKVQGPGDAMVLAGRNIDLNTSGGVGTTGNRENALLPAQSATVTMLAGVSLGQGDYAAAASWYFPALGGTGISSFAPDLAAQLAALQAGSALPAVGSSAAASFKSASVADQITQTQTLVGQAAFDAALLADAQRRAAIASADLATAKTAFAALADADKYKVVSAALATAWAGSVPKAQQRETVAALVAAQGSASTDAAALIAFVAVQTGQTGLGLIDALAAFDGIAPERQLLLTNQVLFGAIRSAGRQAAQSTGSERDAAYAKAYDALAVVFPSAAGEGSLDMGSSQLRTYQNSAIDVLTPRGGVNVGALASSNTPKSASVTGIVTGAGGDIDISVRDNVNVNQSRVFTVGLGDLLIWSSYGNIDAGRGAKTVTGAPPPVFRFDSSGNFVLDTSGSYSGSGIAVLNADSTLDLYAPVGEINAGDAGIKSLGNAFLGAARFVGADNLNVAGASVGAPPPASVGGDTAGLGAIGNASATAGTRVNPDDSEEEKERKRRKRLNLILDFLGFGDGSGKT